MSAEDIQAEQGLPLPGNPYTARRVPGDIQRQLFAPGRRAAMPGETGAPAATPPPQIQIGTVAIYDTLPANAGDFNWTDEFADVSAGAQGTNVIIQTRIVPDGRVFYLRDLRLNIIDIEYTIAEVGTFSIGIPVQTFTYTVFRNYGAEVFNQDIRVEALDNYNPVFLVAGPADVITVAVTYDFSAIVFPVGAIDITVHFLSHMRGELLTPNDMPVVYTALKKD